MIINRAPVFHCLPVSTDSLITHKSHNLRISFNHPARLTFFHQGSQSSGILAMAAFVSFLVRRLSHNLRVFPCAQWSGFQRYA